MDDLDQDHSTDITVRPTFEQLNATLFSRGYLRAPLDVSGLSTAALDALADALHAIIAQREQDLEVRTALTAQTRTLSASLERTRRFLAQEKDRAAEAERKAEAAKARLASVNAALVAEQQAHRGTKEALSRTRRDMALVKASALQHRASSERSVARVRSRIGHVTASALRSSVPDFRIVSSAFASTPVPRSRSLAEEQVEDLEKRRSELLSVNAGLRRMVVDAINALRDADAELAEETRPPTLIQRDVFPPSTANAGREVLDAAVAALDAHVRARVDMARAERRREKEARRAAAEHETEAQWAAELDGHVAAQLAADTKLSLHRSTASNWIEEKRDLENRLIDTARRLAKAEKELQVSSQSKSSEAPEDRKELRRLRNECDRLAAQAKTAQEQSQNHRHNQDEKIQTAATASASTLTSASASTSAVQPSPEGRKTVTRILTAVASPNSNPELDAVFGATRKTAAKTKPDPAPTQRRSARLSGSGSVSETSTKSSSSPSIRSSSIANADKENRPRTLTTTSTTKRKQSASHAAPSLAPPAAQRRRLSTREKTLGQTVS